MSWSTADTSCYQDVGLPGLESIASHVSSAACPGRLWDVSLRLPKAPFHGWRGGVAALMKSSGDHCKMWLLSWWATSTSCLYRALLLARASLRILLSFPVFPFQTSVFLNGLGTVHSLSSSQKLIGASLCVLPGLLLGSSCCSRRVRGEPMEEQPAKPPRLPTGDRK